MTFRLAHLSDCHLGPLPAVQWRDLANKRVLGYLNWQRNRAKAYAPGITETLLHDLKERAPEHVAVTGDLVNLGLEAEFERAGHFLADLGSPQDVTAIPGNHDAYVPGALDRFNTHCAPTLTSDAAFAQPTKLNPHSPYPSVRQRGPVTLIGLSSACATAPFMATGAVSSDQHERMARQLAATRGTFRIVLIHHPPFKNATRWHKRLVGAELLRAIWRKEGCELILHGHTHLPTRVQIDGPDGGIEVYGVASAAQAPGGHKPPASYTLFEIDETPDAWQVRATRRGYRDKGGTITALSDERWSVSRPTTMHR